MIPSRVSMLGAVTSAFGAAASWFCCLPFAFGALGTGSAALANVVGPWRPYLVAVSLLLLAFTFYRVFKPRPTPCDGSGDCPAPEPRRWRRLGLWVALVLTAAFLTVPYWGNWVIYWSL